MWVAVGSQARRELTPASIARGAVVCQRAAAGRVDRGRSARAPRARAACPARWSRDERRGAGRAPAARTSSSCRCWSSAGRCGGRRSIRCRSPDGPGARRGCRRARARRALAACRRPGSTPTPCSRPTAAQRPARHPAGGGRADRRARALGLGGGGRGRGLDAGAAAAPRPAGRPERGEARTLADAFDLALELRIGHHMSRSPPASRQTIEIEPAAISPLMRDTLRDVFRAVTSVTRGGCGGVRLLA